MSNRKVNIRKSAITSMGVCLLVFSSMASSSSYYGTGKSYGFKASSTNVVYESRNVVLAKASTIKSAEKACGKALKRLGPWKILRSIACKGEKAYKTAAKKHCKMKVTITINANSQFSFDKSRASFKPYACRR